MAVEIERKFLVDSNLFKPDTKGSKIIQAYLSNNPLTIVRIRITDNNSFITIKGKVENISRPEFEYEIPISDAHELIRLASSEIIEKTRYEIMYENFLWQVDVFEGKNEGLIVAEIELNTESQSFTKPPWVLSEVSGDSKYFNSALSIHPFSQWK